MQMRYDELGSKADEGLLLLLLLQCTFFRFDEFSAVAQLRLVVDTA